MNYRLISLFHSLLDDLITGCRYKNAHKRADDIKDAIREISPSRYAKDCRLCHAASGPWDQYGGDGDGAFRRRIQPADDIKKRRFSGSVISYDGALATIRNRKSDI